MREKETKLISMVIAALLCAIGIVIPMFAPKIILEPASFTLASHVPIFIALFISPPVALAVSVGTTLGFFFAGFPIVVVLRAVRTHRRTAFKEEHQPTFFLCQIRWFRLAAFGYPCRQ